MKKGKKSNIPWERVDYISEFTDHLGRSVKIEKSVWFERGRGKGVKDGEVRIYIEGKLQ